MRRRSLLFLLGGGMAALPLAARAQPAAIRKIAVLNPGAESDPEQKLWQSTLSETLDGLGWKENTNIHTEYRWAAGDPSRLRKLADDLVRTKPEVILTQGTPGAIAVRQAAPTTPIIFVNVTDPVESGLVSTLAHPGGNITGFSNHEMSMGGKWLEILKEAAPTISRVLVLFNPDNAGPVGQMRGIEEAATTHSIQIVRGPVRNAEDIKHVVPAFASEPNGGILTTLDLVTLTYREAIITTAERARLPAVYGLRPFTKSGGLISYGSDSIDSFRRAASYVDRILKGAKPAELPVQQPIKLEMIVNLKAAKALGLSLPITLIARADEVIE